MTVLTGLTEPIVEHDCSFQYFVWLCMAHHAGWDREHGNAVIDTTQSYFRTRLAQARATLDELHSEKAQLEAMTPEEYDAWDKAKWAQAQQERDEANEERKAVLEKLSRMHHKVEAWELPKTENPNVQAEFRQLKEFMLQQLTSTMEKNAKPYGTLRQSHSRENLIDALDRLIALYRKDERIFEERIETERQMTTQLYTKLGLPDEMKTIR